MKKIKSIFIISLTTLLFLACGKEEPRYSVPAAPVNFTINTNFLDDYLANTGNIGIYIRSKDKASYDDLVAGVKGVKTFSGDRAGISLIGFSGLLVINTGSSLTSTPFAAFDLCCPVEGLEQIRIVPTSEGTAECPQCKSIFTILNGTGKAISGRAAENNKNLQSYLVESKGDSEYRIFY